MNGPAPSRAALSDRRPPPSCTRSLLARIDARARTAGTRVVVTAGADCAAQEAPLAIADALMRSAASGAVLTLELVEDVDELGGAARPADAASAAFCAAVESARDALETLCDAALVLERTAAGAVRISAERWLCGPHVLLAALIAAGTRAPCDDDAGHLDVDAELRGLLGDPFIDARPVHRCILPPR